MMLRLRLTAAPNHELAAPRYGLVEMCLRSLARRAAKEGCLTGPGDSGHLPINRGLCCDQIRTR
jgi:hypothetical protein